MVESIKFTYVVERYNASLSGCIRKRSEIRFERVRKKNRKEKCGKYEDRNCNKHQKKIGM